MAQSAQEWYRRVSQDIATNGYRDCDWSKWASWPFQGALTVKALEPPAAEPLRRGAGGVDCWSCAQSRDLPTDTVLWYDEHYMLTWARNQALPFGAFLGPRVHADLGDLCPDLAARGGQLLALCEQAAVRALDVPRIQVARWGDGGEHLHWWMFARPTGMLQLRGTFLSHWDDVIPINDQEHQLRDMREFAVVLAELAGGVANAPISDDATAT